MSKPKFKLSLKPFEDFPMPVEFVTITGQEAKILFTVKHYGMKEIQAILDNTSDGEKATDVTFLMTVATDWDLEEEFNEDNVTQLVNLFPSAAAALGMAYMKALAGQRVKN